MTEDREDLLRDGRDRAERLLSTLLRLLTDLESNHGSLSAEQHEAGRAALAKVIDSTKRTIAAMDLAIQLKQEHGKHP